MEQTHQSTRSIPTRQGHSYDGPARDSPRGPPRASVQESSTALPENGEDFEAFWTPVQSPQLPAAKSGLARPPQPRHALEGASPHPNGSPAVSGSPLALGSPQSPVRSSRPRRKCQKCTNSICGHFVRALGSAWHLECFTCQDCDQMCASKFFPLELDGEQVPLCEKCYFKRQNLLCYRCGGSLRGSYITALDRKYHVEHFTCSLCSTKFGPDDSYFEHENDVYCRYHYATLYAARCEGCHAAILKQFVETYRGGHEQQWHPECYMIFKFWNVKVPRPSLTSSDRIDASDDDKRAMLARDNANDELILRIWTTLCGFEESCAREISSLVQHAVAGSLDSAHDCASRLIDLVNVLFVALETLPQTQDPLGREPKTLCRKIVSYMSLISKTRSLNGRERLQGLGRELLLLASGMAHYLKVLIRWGLAAALTDSQRPATVQTFLTGISANPASVRPSLESVSPFASDRCVKCTKPVEERCWRLRRDTSKIWHANTCFQCEKCGRSLSTETDDPTEAVLGPRNSLLCRTCGSKELQLPPSQGAIRQINGHGALNVSAPRLVGGKEAFRSVSRLEQYVILLHVALARLELVLGRNHSKSAPTLSSSHKESTNSASTDDTVAKAAASSANDVTRRARELLNNNGADSIEGSSEAQDGRAESLQRTSTLLHAKSALTLDDIRRIVASEQSRPRKQRRETRQRLSLFGSLPSTDIALISQLAMAQLSTEFGLDVPQQDSLASKQTLWEKFGKALGGRSTQKRQVFGQPLDQLVERHGVDSRLGAHPGYQLRIPSFIDDCVAAMRQKDMSIEGVFRKNGNIRRLKEAAERVDHSPDEAGVVADENPIQLAALLKKFLRELPDPLLGLANGRMTRTWLVAGEIPDAARRARSIQLCVASLPKVNRDVLEVLVHFFGWTATFADQGEEQGSKMDVTNLASVLAPTLLFPQTPEGDDHLPAEMYLRAIEPVRLLISQPSLVTQVPQETTALLEEARKLSQPARQQDIIGLVTAGKVESRKNSHEIIQSAPVQAV